jgi:nucleotide-binding universal stress UspA family protein
MAQLGVAFALAQRHDAHVTGMCPFELLLPIDRGYALSGYPDILGLQDFADQIDSRAGQKAERIEAMFREELRRTDVRGDWLVASGPAAQAVARRARTADLVVMGQPDPEQAMSQSARDLVEDTLMTCGRPLLIVPYAGHFGVVGDIVLLGWINAREATRAAHDALMLLGAQTKVTVLSVQRADDTPQAGEVPGADIAEHLARHEIAVTAARTFVDGGLSDADAILGYAADIGADLLVVGGYGHSRTREMILGGVTRSLLRHMTVPVLMSH